MADEGFFHRMRNGGTFRVVTGYDFFVAILTTVILFSVIGRNITEYQLDEFINNSISLSGSLTAVIITGIAILVSFTDSDFLLFLKKEGVYNNLMVTFEYTTLLSIFVSVLGIALQSYNYSYVEAYIFIFFFLYLILAVSRLVSKIVSFGDRKGNLALVNELSSETDKIKRMESDSQSRDSPIEKDEAKTPEEPDMNNSSSE